MLLNTTIIGFNEIYLYAKMTKLIKMPFNQLQFWSEKSSVNNSWLLFTFSYIYVFCLIKFRSKCIAS